VLELLPQPLRLTCPLREHRHHAAVAADLHGGLDCLEIALAPPHGKRAAGAEERAEHRVEELDLRHEVKLPPGPERQAERPGVEARRVVRR
jgi:hypothetical protein